MEGFPSLVRQFSRVGQRYQNGETLGAARLKNRNVTVLTGKKNRLASQIQVFHIITMGIPWRQWYKRPYH